MNRWIVWTVAVVAIALAYARFGWQGAVAAVTLSVFWLLLQFSRVMRVLRQAGHAPMGYVESAVMLQSKLRRGLKLIDVLQLTRSLGERLDGADEPGVERWRWADSGGAEVVLTLRGGKLADWQLVRTEAPAEQVVEPVA